MAGGAMRALAALLLLCSGYLPAVAQSDAPAVARIAGSWYGRIETPERPPRYLEVLGVEPNDRGGHTARAVFGWGDGTVSLTPAEVVATPESTTLALTAATGARLRIEFVDGAAPRGTYQAADQVVRAIRFERLREAPRYAPLLGVWRAQRDGETRLFDVKRVLAAGDGTVLAVGQLGFAEKPDEMRQLVAPVTGDPAAAEIRWATAATAVDLRRSKPTELTGTFRRTDIAAGRADTIVFRQAGEPRPRVGTGGEVGQRFPDFPMVTMDGRTVRLSDFRGKTVVVNFFQPWCIWCIEEFAVWRASVPRYGDKLVILPVVYGVTDGEWLRTSTRAKRYGVPVYGVDKSPVSFKGIPSSWVVGKDGIIVDKMGYQAAHLMFERLDKATK